MKIVLGQIEEVDGKLSMKRAVELPADLRKFPSKMIKGILLNAYLQLLEVERQSEVAELEKLANASN